MLKTIAGMAVVLGARALKSAGGERVEFAVCK